MKTLDSECERFSALVYNYYTDYADYARAPVNCQVIIRTVSGSDV